MGRAAVGRRVERWRGGQRGGRDSADRPRQRWRRLDPHSRQRLWGGWTEAIARAAAMGRTVGDQTLEPITLAYYQYARGISAADVVWAERAANQLRRSVGRFFEAYDVLLTPTLMRTPEPIGKYSQSRDDLNFYD